MEKKIISMLNKVQLVLIVEQTLTLKHDAYSNKETCEPCTKKILCEMGVLISES